MGSLPAMMPSGRSKLAPVASHAADGIPQHGLHEQPSSSYLQQPAGLPGQLTADVGPGTAFYPNFSPVDDAQLVSPASQQPPTQQQVPTKGHQQQQWFVPGRGTASQRPALALPSIGGYRSPVHQQGATHGTSLGSRSALSGPGAAPHSAPAAAATPPTHVLAFNPVGPAQQQVQTPRSMPGDRPASDLRQPSTARVLFSDQDSPAVPQCVSRNSRSLRQRALSTAAAHDNVTKLVLHVITYNMAGILPRKLPHTLFAQQQAPPDIVVVGTQESCSLGDWERLVCKHLGGAYVKVAQESLMSISLLVFASKKWASNIHDVKTSSVPCGIGNMLGNKGGVAVSCTIAGVRVLLITSHLAAHDEFVDRRNLDYQRIYSGLFGAAATTGNMPVAAKPGQDSGTSTPRAQSRTASPQRSHSDGTMPADAMSPVFPSGAAHIASPAPGSAAHSARVSRLKSSSSMAQLPQPVSASPSVASGLAALGISPRTTTDDVPHQQTPPHWGTPDGDVASTRMGPAGARTGVDAEGSLATLSRAPLLTSLPTTVSANGAAEVPNSAARSVPGAVPHRGGSVIPAHDAVIWGGDLNYRINGTTTLIRHLINNNMTEVLHANDQLRIQMKRRKAFQGFHEQAINFPPTFKYNATTYSDKRVPSWTDRILSYEPADKQVDCELEPLYYTDVPELMDSDHRAVVAGYQLIIHQDKPPASAPRKKHGACTIS